MDGYLVTRDTLDRLDRALPRVERGVANTPNLNPWQVARETRWIPCYNSSASEEIPPLSVVRMLTSPQNEGTPLIYVAQQSTVLNRALYITGPEAIAPHGFGLCSNHGELCATFDNAQGNPMPGETWGAKDGSYKLFRHFPGFRVVEAEPTTGTVFVVAEPPSLILGKCSTSTPGGLVNLNVFIGPIASLTDSGLIAPTTWRSYWGWPRMDPTAPLSLIDWVQAVWINGTWVPSTPNYPIIRAKATANWRSAGATTTVACTLIGADTNWSGPSVTAQIQPYYAAGMPAPNILATDELTVTFVWSRNVWSVLDPVIDAAIGTVRLTSGNAVPRGWALMDGLANSVGNGGSGINMNGKFPRGSSAAGGTGGSDTHKHTATLGDPNTTVTLGDGTGIAQTPASGTHTHEVTVNNTSWLPSYVELRFIERLNNAAP